VPRVLKAALDLPVSLVEGYKGTADIRLAADGGEVGGCWAWESVKVTSTLNYAFTPAIFRSYRLKTFSRSTFLSTCCGRWPSSRAMTAREWGQVEAAWG